MGYWSEKPHADFYNLTSDLQEPTLFTDGKIIQKEVFRT